jgi:hypothetical protein
MVARVTNIGAARTPGQGGMIRQAWRPLDILHAHHRQQRWHGRQCGASSGDSRPTGLVEQRFAEVAPPMGEDQPQGQ